jgi:histidyl-tRNA synthetase
VPLARFYATHRAALPPVFRAIQIAPVWRAERPQKGRYRQFVQCDIDIIGEAGPLAELELLTATVAALDALGLAGCRIRLNDRRILSGILASWGVADELRERALITIDKLDKIGPDGVAAELATLGVEKADVADELRQLASADWSLADGVAPPPAWLDLDAYRDLIALRDAVPGTGIDFDPTLVRGMGYYTGTIFEIAHPDFGYSLGGGGRYDHMIGRFLGQEVPACGFSIGFERIVDLLAVRDEGRPRSVVLVYDPEVAPAELLGLKHELVASGMRVRFERRAKNLRGLLDRVSADGFDAWASVTADTTDAASLAFRDLGA